MNTLNRLLDYLNEINASVVGLLQKGLTKDEIQIALAKEGIEPNEDIQQFYQTINGTLMNNEYLGLQYFFPGHIMLSLEKSIELYKEECFEYSSWEQGYLPIFWNGNRDYLLTDCLDRNKGIYFYSPDEFRFDGLAKKYDSLESLFTTVLRCFQVKAYQLGKTLKDIKYDGEKVIAISKEMNPDSEYWLFN